MFSVARSSLSAVVRASAVAHRSARTLTADRGAGGAQPTSLRSGRSARRVRECIPLPNVELTGRQRQGARPGPQRMYLVPAARAWWSAVGAPVERQVRQRSRCFDSDFYPNSDQQRVVVRSLGRCLVLKVVLTVESGLRHVDGPWWLELRHSDRRWASDPAGVSGVLSRAGYAEICDRAGLACVHDMHLGIGALRGRSTPKGKYPADRLL